MKKSYLMLLLVAMFALVSCNYNESEIVVNTTETSNDAIVDGKVSLSRAISNADFVFKNTEGLGNKTRKIKNVDVLKRANAASRVTRTSSLDEQDALAYVVNYDNNEGFAILAATTKLPPVISIGDEGNFNTEGFVNFIQNNGATRSGEDINPAQNIQYAIVSNSLSVPTFDFGDEPLNGVDTTVIFKCLPLVPTKWGQNDPYNYYAYDTQNRKSKAGCVPVAGAQVLASLCYHHNWRPTTQLSDEYYINWYAINRMIYAGVYNFSYGDYSNQSLAVASLIRAVGEDVNAQYSPGGTEASTSYLDDTYRKLGMTSAIYHNNSTYIKDHIFNMVVYNSYPVNVRADDSNLDTGGHSFIIDGWLRLEYSVLTYEYIQISNENSIIKPDNNQRNFDLVHTNFGWKGACDGYYLLDAIDLTKDKYREFAENNDAESSEYPYIFDLYIEYITYDL